MAISSEGLQTAPGGKTEAWFQIYTLIPDWILILCDMMRSYYYSLPATSPAACCSLTSASRVSPYAFSAPFPQDYVYHHFSAFSPFPAYLIRCLFLDSLDFVPVPFINEPQKESFL